MTKPLMIDLYAGLGGWAEGGLAEGYDVVGFDIEQHVYGEHRYPAQLVVQDVLTLHGSQFKTATLIVASPPCQEYSYMAMPWSRAKAKAAAIRADKTGKMMADLNRLFDACFRIQREACEAAGRHIPMVVENVRGANEWVGRSRWNFGSFHLWGDVPALMPPIKKIAKVPGFRFDGSGKSFQTASVRQHFVCDCENPEPETGAALISEECPIHNLYPRQPPDGTKYGGCNGKRFDERPKGNVAAHREGTKTAGHIHRRNGHATTKRLTNPAEWQGVKQPGINLSDVGFNVANAQQFAHMVDGVKIKRSDEDKRQHIGVTRKFASAQIAKIPLPLSRHIAATFRPVSPPR